MAKYCSNCGSHLQRVSRLTSGLTKVNPKKDWTPKEWKDYISMVFNNLKRGKTFLTGDRPGHRLFIAKEDDPEFDEYQKGDLVWEDWNDTGDVIKVMRPSKDNVEKVFENWFPMDWFGENTFEYLMYMGMDWS